MVTPISMPVSGFYKRPRSSVPTKEGSLLAKYAEKYAIKVNTFRSAYIVSALLWDYATDSWFWTVFTGESFVIS